MTTAPRASGQPTYPPPMTHTHTRRALVGYRPFPAREVGRGGCRGMLTRHRGWKGGCCATSARPPRSCRNPESPIPGSSCRIFSCLFVFVFRVLFLAFLPCTTASITSLHACTTGSEPFPAPPHASGQPLLPRHTHTTRARVGSQPFIPPLSIHQSLRADAIMVAQKISESLMLPRRVEKKSCFLSSRQTGSSNGRRLPPWYASPSPRGRSPAGTTSHWSEWQRWPRTAPARGRWTCGPSCAAALRCPRTQPWWSAGPPLERARATGCLYVTFLPALLLVVVAPCFFFYALVASLVLLDFFFSFLLPPALLVSLAHRQPLTMRVRYRNTRRSQK